MKTGPEGQLLPARPQAHASGAPPIPAALRLPGLQHEAAATRRVTLGTSVGWSDVYPPTYPEQWIDVTGLRGCFAYRHIADPRNGIYESNERNNAATVTIRLPFRPGAQRCPRARRHRRRRRAADRDRAVPGY